MFVVALDRAQGQLRTLYYASLGGLDIILGFNSSVKLRCIILKFQEYQEDEEVQLMSFGLKMQSLNSQTEILWRQVWGLGALLAAIIFSFMAYGFYQPKILNDLGFVELAARLGIVQGLIGVVIEPLIGGISDSILRRFGSRLPMISVGVSLAGLIFVIVGLLLQGNLSPGMRWLVPVLMTVWVTAMIVFRGPAIALLTQFAPVKELPLASAVLTLVSGIVGALGPLLAFVLKSIGASPTFLLGAIVLVIGAFILFSSTPRHTLAFANEQIRSSPISTVLLGLIFIVGLGAGLEINLLLGIFPKVLSNQISGIPAEFVTSGILLVSAVTAIPVGKFTIKLGVIKSLLLGMGAIAGVMTLTLSNHSPILAVGIILAFGTAISLIFSSPFAFVMLPAVRAGLGAGLYFGAMGGSTALSSIIMKQPGGMMPTVAVWWSAIAFLVAGLCLVVSKRFAS